MKPFSALTTLLRALAGAVVGFAAVFAFVRLKENTSTPPPEPVETAAASAVAVSGEVEKAPALPEAGAFLEMDAEAKLACALRLRRLPAEERAKFLEECLTRAEPERTALLALLLSQWAEMDPVAAAEWTLKHLEKETALKCVNDIAATWAARDGKGLAEWVNALFRENKEDPAAFFRSAASNALERHDPYWHATFLEMECNQTSTYTGMDYSRSLRTLEEVKAMGGRLKGHVAYIDNAEDLKLHVSQGSTARHVRLKWGWNELFEETAVAWHRLDPEGCEAWLETWPENAQFTARHFIEKARVANTSGFPVEESAEPPAPVEVQAEVEPEPAPAPPGPDAPVSEEAAERARLGWAAWWRRDAAAAEAFLESARWPERLKFRARAEAYSSPP